MIFPNKGKECIEITKELKRLHKQPFEKDKRMSLKRAAIISYELGELNHFLVYDDFSDNEMLLKSYGELAKHAMGDLVIQLRMICLDQGWEFDLIQKQGLEHRKERQKEIISDTKK